MGMNVNDKWYAEAQRYNDTIYPQNGHQFDEKDWARYNKNRERYGKDWNRAGKEPYHHEKDWRRHDMDAAPVAKSGNAPTRELSPAAQKLMDKLKKMYDNVDFSVAGSNNSADAQAKLAGGSKKYSVLFTNDEIERMAADESYQNEMLDKMHEGFQTVAKAKSDFDTGVHMPEVGLMRRVAVTYNSDGSTSMYAEMSKRINSQRAMVHATDSADLMRNIKKIRRPVLTK